jgi:hypothetical protein
MVDKGNLAIDPRGLIFESYRIDGIVTEECRSIFLDWALGLAIGTDMQAALQELADEYADRFPDHPMTAIIAEGLARAAVPTGRRRGRSRR